MEQAKRYRRYAALTVLSLALSLPALVSGFFNDDLYFDNPLIHNDSPFEYYDFAEKLGARGLWHWWASPDLSIRFFRPLSSATLYLDFGVWGGHPLAAHLHSALWFVMLLVGAFALLDVLLRPNEAPWAQAIYAIGVHHGTTVGWIAARHAAVGGAFALWSAFCYVRFRKGNGPGWLAASAILSLLSLFSSEVGLTVGLFVVSYEMLFSGDAVLTRIKAALPLVGVMLLYLLFYKLNGYGPKGSALYLDPVAQPAAYLKGLLPKMLSLAGAYLMGFPAIFRTVPGTEAVPPAAGVIGLLVLGGAAYAARPFEATERRRMKWLALMSVMCALPAAAGLPDGRGTVLSSMGIAAISGMVIARLVQMHKEKRRPIGVRVSLVLLFLGLFVFPGGCRFMLSVFEKRISELQQEHGSVPTGCATGSDVYLVNGDFMAAIYAPVVVATYQGVFFERWLQLTEPIGDIVVTRNKVNTLTVSAGGRPLVDGMMYGLTRSDAEPVAEGATIDIDGLSVEILETSADGPTKAAFTIPNLTDKTVTCLLTVDKGILRPFSLPKIGASRRIALQLPVL